MHLFAYSRSSAILFVISAWILYHKINSKTHSNCVSELPQPVTDRVPASMFLRTVIR